MIYLCVFLKNMESLQLLKKCTKHGNIKLDRVGPIDNRPSTDQLQHFVHFFLKIFCSIKKMLKKKNILTCDM